ncbi:MAG: hypothetical protein ACPGRX_02410 [Bdellovibrionales bacterium]
MTSPPYQTPQTIQYRDIAGDSYARLIAASQDLLTFLEDEEYFLARNDLMAFYALQSGKRDLATRYTAASQKFRSRAESYRGMDQAALDDLETLQAQIGARASANNAVLLRLRKDGGAHGGSTLLTAQLAAQDIGQNSSANSNAPIRLCPIQKD